MTVPRGILPANVYILLREEIISGQLAAGATLIETAIASRMGVSRTPVREALRLLSYDGLVESSGRTLRVTGRSPQALFDLYDVRIPLEIAAARAAAERHTNFDHLQISNFHERMQQADPGDQVAVAEANRIFHEAIRAATHNSALIDFLNRLDLYLRRYPVTALHHAGRYEASMQEHDAMLAAILERDGAAAGRLAETHFVEARDIRLRLYPYASYGDERGDSPG